MKKFFKLFAWSCLLAVMACSAGDSQRTEDSLLPVQSGTKYGYIDSKGNFVINPQFMEADYFSDNMAKVSLDGKVGYVDEAGEYLIPPRYEMATRFAEGRAWVTSLSEGELCLIDKNGEILAVRKDAIEAYAFSNGISVVAGYEDNVYLVDKAGRNLCVLPKGLTVETDFSEGLALVRDQDSKYGYINTKGNLVISCRFKDGLSFRDGQAVVKDDSGSCGVIDKDGNYIINPQFDAMIPDGKLYVIRMGNQCGWCNRQGKIVINPQFDICLPFDGGKLAPVSIGDKWGYVDKDGKLRVNPQFEGALPFTSTGVAFVMIGRKVGLINPKGEYVANPQFTNVVDPDFVRLLDFAEKRSGAFARNFYVEGITAHVLQLLEDNKFDGMQITQTSITDFRKKYNLSGNAVSWTKTYSKDVNYNVRAVGTFSHRVSDGWWGTVEEALPEAKLEEICLTLMLDPGENPPTLYASLKEAFGGLDKGRRDSGQYFRLSQEGDNVILRISDKPLD